MNARDGFHRDPDPHCPDCLGTGITDDTRGTFRGYCQCTDRGPGAILVVCAGIAAAALILARLI